MALAISTVSTARLAGCCTAPLVAISCGQKIKLEKRQTTNLCFMSLARPPSKYETVPIRIRTILSPSNGGSNPPRENRQALAVLTVKSMLHVA